MREGRRRERTRVEVWGVERRCGAVCATCAANSCWQTPSSLPAAAIIGRSLEREGRMGSREREGRMGRGRLGREV